MAAERALAALRRAPLNFEPGSVASFTPQTGWHVDALSQRLPGERPNDPAPSDS